MARASVKIFKDTVLIAETNIETPDVPISDELVDKWTDMFREIGLAQKSLNVEDWNTIEYNVDGTTYIRNF